MNSYFKHQAITEHVKRILLPGDVFAYLVEGEETTTPY